MYSSGGRTSNQNDQRWISPQKWSLLHSKHVEQAVNALFIPSPCRQTSGIIFLRGCLSTNSPKTLSQTLSVSKPLGLNTAALPGSLFTVNAFTES